MAIAALSDLAHWAVYSLGESPFPGTWCFNPSVLATPDGRWLCSVRCSNYHMPGSTFAARMKQVKVSNRNLLLELEPKTWRVLAAHELVDATDGKKLGTWSGAGFEDLRLIWSDALGVSAIGSAMRPDFESGGVNEIVSLELDDEYQIVKATPLRGSWSTQHQKNWSPFQGEPEPRMLYSPLDGGIHDLSGRLVATHDPLSLDEDAALQDRVIESPAMPGIGGVPTRVQHGAIEVQINRRTMPREVMEHKPTQVRLALRGGTQLVRPRDGDDVWLGIAHGCRIERGFKMYWHRAYTVNAAGDLLELGQPFKLAPKVGIEFAAGLAIDRERDRAMISFGIEDDSAWLGETTISGLLATLRPIPLKATAGNHRLATVNPSKIMDAYKIAGPSEDRLGETALNLASQIMLAGPALAKTPEAELARCTARICSAYDHLKLERDQLRAQLDAVLRPKART